MRIVSLCLLSLAIGCARNEAASAPLAAVASSDLDECTELVRGLLLQAEGSDAELAKQRVECDARVKILTQKLEAATAQVKQNAWLARWGLPIGAVGGGIAAAVITALVLGLNGNGR